MGGTLRWRPKRITPIQGLGLVGPDSALGFLRAPFHGEESRSRADAPVGGGRLKTAAASFTDSLRRCVRSVDPATPGPIVLYRCVSGLRVPVGSTEISIRERTVVKWCEPYDWSELSPHWRC
jgi:hypothetical protein